MREVHGLAHDHSHQLLRSGYRDNAVNRQRLEHGEQHVGGSRRHVDEQVVDLAPVRLAVELTDGVRDDRAAPATGMSSFGSMRLVDITLMPLCVWPGRMPSASAVSGFVMPKVFGWTVR